MSSPVLLVIDLQRGAFDGVRCPVIDRPTELVRNARTLIDAARAAGAPIVFIQHCDEPGEAFEENTPHWPFHEELSPSPDEPVIRKRASSAFENTDLATTLKQLNAGELMLCGLQSEFCVANTAKSALDHGYRVRIAQDAHGTWPSRNQTSAEISAAVNAELAARGALIEPTARVAAALRDRT